MGKLWYGRAGPGCAAAPFVAAILLASGLSVAPATSAQQAEDAAGVRELAERLLLQAYSYPGGQPPSALLLPGQLPPDLPVQLPVPAGGRLLGSLVRTGEPQASMEVVIDAPGSPRNIQVFYEHALAERGWTPPPSYASYEGYRPSQGGGFQPQMMQPVYTGYFCGAEEGSYAMMTIRPPMAATGASDVRFTVYSATASSVMGGRARGYGPCSAQALAPPQPMMYSSNPLPSLMPPVGVSLQTTGGGGGMNSWSSEAVAQTEMSVSQLETHFAGQLSEGGWSRVDGGTAGPVAWSAWDVPGEVQWRGLLLVIDLPGENRRALSVRADTASTELGPGSGYYTSYPYYSAPYPAAPPVPSPGRSESD